MLLGLLAGIIGIAGYIPYIRDILKGTTQPDDILKGTTKPDKASWLIWTLEYAALFAAQLSAGAKDSLWLIGLQLVGVIVICGLSFTYGTGKFDRQSVLILAAVCASLLVWYFSRSASLTILLLITVEAVGVALTARKVYRQPGSETLIMWALIAVAGVLGVAAVGLRAEWILYVYPVALVLMGLSVIAASRLGAQQAAKHTTRKLL
jgi:hypothetical protein